MKYKNCITVLEDGTNCKGKGTLGSSGNLYFTKGLCRACYNRNIRKGHIGYERQKELCCSVILEDGTSCKGKGSPKYGKEWFVKGFCAKHYRKNKLYGNPTEKDKRLVENTVESHELYYTYSAMKARCYNKNFKHYNRYGGRGIKICDRWLDSFLSFVEDVGERPENHSLDRINNDGDYEPSNCKWSTPREQSYNRSNSNKNVGVCYRKNNDTYSVELRVGAKRYNKSGFKLESEAISYRKELEQLYL
jgi:hypothetical protein